MGLEWTIAILLLYALTLFVGATLLFAVQPMVGKMILPLLGGTPAVWSTCLVFFQAALLAGYAYAHVTTRWLSARRQALLHLAVLLGPLAVLPLGIDAARVRGGESNPVLGVLIVLSLSIGLPFFVVSATAPLLQRWFTHTGHGAAHDPYFLYAASNLGSMLALLAYPTLIEPSLNLQAASWSSQTRLWTAGYVLLAVLILACAVALQRSRPASLLDGEGAAEEAARIPESPPRWGRRRLSWIALAFVPSSLLLGATTYITTDIAAVPLLWVLPLAIYLCSFILAFGRWPARWHAAVVTAMPVVVLLTIFLMVSDLRQRIWVTVIWHLVVLLVVALACHGELALDRPPPRRLTEFYLLISVGGVLGGLFNALVAPLVFNTLVEYPLVMVLACVLVTGRPVRVEGRHRLLSDIALALGVSALALVLYSKSVSLRVDFGFAARLLNLSSDGVGRFLDPLERTVNAALAYGPPLVVAFLLGRPIALGLALAGVLAVSGFVDARQDDQILRARSFFGVLQVTRDRGESGYTDLRHGTTLHGRQSVDPARRAEPLSYYHREGPIGQIFAELTQRYPRSLSIAVVGLGTGTVAAYARTGDGVTFYEIDRVVRDIAFDRKYFTYVADARDRAAIVRVELGDARVRMDAVRRDRPGECYDVIIVDAFTSDAIPVHLLTREALRLYAEMLAPDGLVVLHLSNRYLRLEPVVANLAADLGLEGRLLQHDDAPGGEGAARSTWAVLARTPQALGGLAHDERWTTATLEVEPRVGTWTDDFHNLLTVFKW